MAAELPHHISMRDGTAQAAKKHPPSQNQNPGVHEQGAGESKTTQPETTQDSDRASDDWHPPKQPPQPIPKNTLPNQKTTVDDEQPAENAEDYNGGGAAFNDSVNHAVEMQHQQEWEEHHLDAMDRHIDAARGVADEAAAAPFARQHAGPRAAAAVEAAPPQRAHRAQRADVDIGVTLLDLFKKTMHKEDATQHDMVSACKRQSDFLLSCARLDTSLTGALRTWAVQNRLLKETPEECFIAYGVLAPYSGKLLVDMFMATRPGPPDGPGPDPMDLLYECPPLLEPVSWPGYDDEDEDEKYVHAFGVARWIFGDTLMLDGTFSQSAQDYQQWLEQSAFRSVLCSTVKNADEHFADMIGAVAEAPRVKQLLDFLLNLDTPRLYADLSLDVAAVCIALSCCGDTPEVYAAPNSLVNIPGLHDKEMCIHVALLAWFSSLKSTVPERALKKIATAIRDASPEEGPPQGTPAAGAGGDQTPPYTLHPTQDAPALALTRRIMPHEPVYDQKSALARYVQATKDTKKHFENMKARQAQGQSVFATDSNRKFVSGVTLLGAQGPLNPPEKAPDLGDFQKAVTDAIQQGISSMQKKFQKEERALPEDCIPFAVGAPTEGTSVYTGENVRDDDRGRALRETALREAAFWQEVTETGAWGACPGEVSPMYNTSGGTAAVMGLQQRDVQAFLDSLDE